MGGNDGIVVASNDGYEDCVDDGTALSISVGRAEGVDGSNDVEGMGNIVVIGRMLCK